jgi:hypothetical protein
MTDIVDEGGWLWFSDESGSSGDYLKVSAKRVLHDMVEMPLMLEHYEGGVNFDVGGGKEYSVFIIDGIYLESHTNYAAFMSNILSWLKNSTLYLEVIRDSSLNRVAWNGTDTKYKVALVNKIQAGQKISRYNRQVYMLNRLLFEQGG